MACAVICSICTDPFHSLDSVACTTCGHIFHDVCIRNWMERSNLCPICRSYCSNIKKVYLNFDGNIDGEVRNNDLKFKLQQTENNLKALLDKITEMDKQYRELQKEYNLSESNFLNLHKQYTELDESNKNMNAWLTEVHDVPSQMCEKSVYGQKASTKIKDNIALPSTFEAVNKRFPEVSSNINLFDSSLAVASTSGVNIMRPNNIFSLSPTETTKASTPYPFNFGHLSSFHKQHTNPQIASGFLNPISAENETHSNNAFVSSQSSPYALAKNTHLTVTASSTIGITTSASSCRSLAKPNQCFTVWNVPFPFFQENRESTSKERTVSFESSEKNETASIFAASNLSHMNSITINSQKNPFEATDSTRTNMTNNENLSNSIFRFGCSPNSATSDPTLDVKSTTNPTTLSNCNTVAASTPTANTTNSAIYSNSMCVDSESGPSHRMRDAPALEKTVIASPSDSSVIASSTINNNIFVFGDEENTRNISENPTASSGSFAFFGQAKDPTGSTLPNALPNFADYFAKLKISSNKFNNSNARRVKKAISKR
uniref:RING-type domain-containing protein n=1 Tax=Glossina austeni TaxID=7395 RepID=A0A1A9URG3_GLOAU